MDAPTPKPVDAHAVAAMPRIVALRRGRRRMAHVEGLSEAVIEGLWTDVDSLLGRARVIKSEGRSIVARLPIGGSTPAGGVLLKRYVPRGWLHLVTHAFYRSRAKWSWTMGWRIRSAGVRTPVPLAVVEDRLGPFVWGGAIVTEFIEGRDLHATATDETTPVEKMQSFREQLREMWERLGAARITCDDIKANNFMIDEGGSMWLVDLDGARQWPRGVLFECVYRRKRRKDRESFLRRWVEYPHLQSYFAGCVSDG